MDRHYLAYLSQGKLHLRGENRSATVESEFGRSLRERAVQIHRRHAWKTEGRSAQFMSGMLWPSQAGDPAEFRIAITGVTPGAQPGELLYSMETDEISGIFHVSAEGVEQRLFHTADFRVRNVAFDGNGSGIAGTIVHRNMTANIAVAKPDGSDLAEVSEGDSYDIAPRWVPGKGRRIVFQSAGLGRDGAGRFLKLGPSSVQELDLDSGEIECLAEDAEYDFLGPQKGADGALYFIRRPRENKDRKSVNPLTVVLDIVMLVPRLLYAVFQFFNFFSMKYTGKPLTTSRGAIQRKQDLKQMMIWGNLIDVNRAVEENGQDQGDAPNLVPSSWQLVKKTASGSEVLAKSVLSFDIGKDGTILYSNGSAVHRLAPGKDKAERVFVGSMIELVAAL